MKLPIRQRRRRNILVAALAAVALTVGLGVVGASAAPATSSSSPGIAPVMTCAQVAALDLASIPGAVTEISSATPLAASANTQGSWAACQVEGTIAPQIQFELLLPTTTWQGEYLQTGCGGYCGTLNISAPASVGCTPLTDGAFAMASDNEGHYGTSGSFGSDPTLRASFGYQSEHQLALAAKAIIATYYGIAARYSYFDGCSQGGHEALTEAQRYPTDFNGIIAGSPASIMTELNVFYQAWNAQANTAPDGSAVLTAGDLAPLHQAVLKACDAVGGLIADPLACHFDPASIACDGRASTASDFCLTSAQVTTVRELYEGPRDANGRLLYPGWQLPGSELNWAGWIVPTGGGQPTIDQTIATETLRYMVSPNVNASASYTDVKFTAAEFRELTRANDGMYDATDPDLSAFRAAGGKLILWAGWADPAISPVGTIAYYQAVENTMGGAQATSQFARLFLLPGVSHCGSGQGPSDIDALSAVTNWVTTGQAPAGLLSSSVDSSGKTTATRPVYPYPEIAVDTTGGPADEASSYTPEQGTQLATVNWLGSFRSGYETVSGWVDGQWVTRPGKS